MGWGIDGFKLRALFAVPEADDRKVFLRRELRVQLQRAAMGSRQRFTSEVRPIVGWHLKPIDVIINPIVDTAYDGLGNLEFVPAARVASNLSSSWALAAEEYDDFGPLHKFLPGSEQVHQLYGGDRSHAVAWDVEAGVGFGLTDASDHLTLKLILSRDLNTRKIRPYRSTAALRLDDVAIWRPRQKARIDQRVHQLGTRLGVQSPQTLRLRFGQYQSRHVEKFSAHPPEDSGPVVTRQGAV